MVPARVTSLTARMLIRFGNKIVEEEHDVSSIKVIFKTSNLNIKIHLCE